MLRYGRLLPVDQLFLQAGDVLWKYGQFSEAYVYYSRYLDLLDSILENCEIEEDENLNCSELKNWREF